MAEAARSLSQDIVPYAVPVLTQGPLRPCLDNLESFLDRYAPRFYRTEHRDHACTVIEGLLSDLSRKTVEPIAVDHDQHRRPLQRFVGAGRWDDRKVLDEFHRHVAETYADPQGVLVLDSSGFPKKGTESVGVKRQWCGRLGKIENCQLGVFLAYASGRGGTLVDRELYLPREWTRSRKRRKKTHIPDDIRYRSTVQIADEMLRKDAVRFPHAWIVGDDEFGRITWFRYALKKRGERYLLEVPANTLIRDLEADPPGRPGRRGKPRKNPFVQALRWAEAQPSAAWARFHVRDGEKGPIELEAIRCRVQTREDGKVGREETLLVTRTLESPREWKCWLAPAEVGASLEEMVWAGSMRHRVEEFIEMGKQDAGLADYEVRSWVGWHHHMTLSLLALFFLTLEHQRMEKKGPGADRLHGGDGRRQASA